MKLPAKQLANRCLITSRQVYFYEHFKNRMELEDSIETDSIRFNSIGFC